MLLPLLLSISLFYQGSETKATFKNGGFDKVLVVIDDAIKPEELQFMTKAALQVRKYSKIPQFLRLSSFRPSSTKFLESYMSRPKAIPISGVSRFSSRAHGQPAPNTKSLESKVFSWLTSSWRPQIQFMGESPSLSNQALVVI